MTTAEQYVDLVMRHMPPATPSREHIAMELQGHIAERVHSGQPLDAVLQQLGDPAALAAGYMSAIPLVSGSFGARAAAKLLDVLLVLVFAAPAAWFAWRTLPPLVGLVFLAAGLGFYVYTVGYEFVSGQTLGKRVMGLRVVQESGTRLSLGRAIVRQLPLVFQVFWIDILFVPFTEHNQRAFELLSKTRVVVASPTRHLLRPLS